MEMLIQVICTAGGFLFLVHKLIGWRGIAQHKAKVDIGCSLLAYFIFAGTSTQGILVAVMTGFIISVFTSIFGKVYTKKAAKKEVEPLQPLSRFEEEVRYHEEQFARVAEEAIKRVGRDMPTWDELRARSRATKH